MSTQAYQIGGNGFATIPNSPIFSPRDPAITDIVSPSGNAYQLGQLWKNTVSGDVFEYLGGGVWVEIAESGGGPITTLTGNSGGAIGPTAGNINIVGNATTTVVGSGSTLTITQTAAGYPITSYVVGPAGQAGYQTIQSAITAAAAEALGGVVYVKPGTYVENLTFPAGVKTQIVGAVGEEDVGNIILQGAHVPPLTGDIVIRNFQLKNTSSIFSSNNAGNGEISLQECTSNITVSGWTFNLPNWTGALNMNNSGDISVSNGVLNNSASAIFYSNNGQIGAGSLNTFTSANGAKLDLTYLVCPANITSGNIIGILSVLGNTFTIGGNTTGDMWLCDFIPGANQALVFNSSGNVTLHNGTINSSNNPSIGGNGVGILTLADMSFLSNSAMAATLTLGTADVLNASTFRTSPLATNVSLSGNTLSATGSNTNIDINATPKGTGSIIYSASRAGSNLNYQATNSDNTNGASAAGFQAAVGGGTAGDPYTQYAVSGVTTWTTGIDNSASDAYVIAASNALGTSNAASWSTAGALTNTAGITASTGNIVSTAGTVTAGTSITAGTTLTATLGAITATNGNLVLNTAGNKIVSTSVGSGASAGANSFGSATLTNGTVTVSTTAVTASSIIILSRNSIGTTGANPVGILSVGTVNAGTSFVINAVTTAVANTVVATDQSVIGWMIIN